jgi:hypothetical protein
VQGRWQQLPGELLVEINNVVSKQCYLCQASQGKPQKSGGTQFVALMVQRDVCALCSCLPCYCQQQAMKVHEAWHRKTTIASKLTSPK